MPRLSAKTRRRVVVLKKGSLMMTKIRDKLLEEQIQVSRMAQCLAIDKAMVEND